MFSGDTLQPFGRIETPLYDAVVENCQNAFKDFHKRGNKLSREEFIQTILKPIFLDVEPLRHYTVFLLNNGLLQEYIRANSNRKIDLPAKPSFVDEFLAEEKWGDRVSPRPYRTAPMPERIYKEFVERSTEQPIIMQTLQTIQTIVTSHIDNIRTRLPPREAHVTDDQKLVRDTLDTIWNAAEKTFLEELAPFVVMAVGQNAHATNNLEPAFAQGLSGSFNHRAYTVLKTETSEKTKETITFPLQCPFITKIKPVWNTNIIKGEDGIYKISNEPRGAAFPSLIARLISDAASDVCPKHAATCPYVSHTP